MHDHPARFSHLNFRVIGPPQQLSNAIIPATSNRTLEHQVPTFCSFFRSSWYLTKSNTDVSLAGCPSCAIGKLIQGVFMNKKTRSKAITTKYKNLTSFRRRSIFIKAPSVGL